jgi:hypothetical protein
VHVHVLEGGVRASNAASLGLYFIAIK